MFDWLTELVSASPVAYPVVAGFVTLDAFFPVVPGETLVITAAVLAAEGGLAITLVLLSAFVGALAGDNVSYLLGAKLGRRAAPRLFSSQKGRRHLEWAKDQLRERGAVIIVGARFVPGGRTAVTFAAGTLGMRWRKFIGADLAGAALWALFATGLGWFGGEAFKESLWKPLALAFAVAAVVALSGEAYRRATSDSGRRHDSAADAPR